METKDPAECQHTFSGLGSGHSVLEVTRPIIAWVVGVHEVWA